MTEMYDPQILEILQEATAQAVEASSTPNLPIKFIGRTFVVPNDQKYLEEVFIPNNRQGAYWGDEKDYRGLYRLILHWVNDDTGAHPGMLALASICSFFGKGTWLQNVKISDNPDLTGVLEEGSELLYPASVRYQCFRPS